MSVPLFTVYTEIPRALPQAAWRCLRWIGVATGLGIGVAGLLRPAAALTAFWFVFVPLAPLLFLVAPGLWRNTCPMASLNQLPRALGFSRELTVPRPVSAVAPLISAGLFLAIVPLRRVWLDRQGQALGVFLLTMLALALAGGVIFNPTAAQLADLGDDDPRWSGCRTAVAGLLPWLIVAFHTMDPLGSVTPGAIAGVYGRLLLACAAGIGTFQVIETVTGLSRFHVVVLHVVAAINLFYWYTAPRVLGHLGVTPGAVSHIIQGGVHWGVALISVAWLVRAWPRDRAFAASDAMPGHRRVSGATPPVAAGREGGVEVAFLHGPTVLARAGDTLLEVAERNGVRIPAGCRMGMCGADPVRILAGVKNLDAPTGTERATLQRVGAGEGCRMACVARPIGPVSVSLDPAAPALAAGGREATEGPEVHHVDPGVRRVVVVGTGAAGITAVTELRRLHAHLELTVVGSELHDFYNRMTSAGWCTDRPRSRSSPCCPTTGRRPAPSGCCVASPPPPSTETRVPSASTPARGSATTVWSSPPAHAPPFPRWRDSGCRAPSCCAP
jgi:ferredoxin